MNKNNVTDFKDGLLNTIKNLENNYHKLNLLRSYGDPVKRNMHAKDKSTNYYYSDVIYDAIDSVRNKSKIIFFSDKLDLIDLTILFICKVSEIPAETLLSGNLTDQQWPTLVMATAFLNDSNIKFVSIKDLSNKKVEDLICKAAKTHKNSLLIADYSTSSILKSRTKADAIIRDLTRMNSKLAVSEKALYSKK